MGRKHVWSHRICRMCGKPFSVKPAIPTRCCSRECGRASKRKHGPRTCPSCGVVFTPGKPKPDGTLAGKGKKFCCKKCADVGLRGLHRGEKSAVWRGGPKHSLLHIYRKQATKRGLPFTITEEQFNEYWQKDCHYCGSPIETIGLDRVVNARGYEPDNIVPCCILCNRMKMALSVDVFLSQIAKISATIGGALSPVPHTSAPQIAVPDSEIL